jgi:hypothetical protein
MAAAIRLLPTGAVMLMLRRSLLAVVALAAASLAAPAHATSSTGIAVERQWGLMDKCVRTAIAKFPDRTPADLAKRDEFAGKCQRDSRVPIRDGLAPK